MCRWILIGAFLVLSYPLPSIAILRNVTFDDTDPAIRYIGPDGAWNASTDVCDACANPPTTLAQRQTYHFGAYIVPADDDTRKEDHTDATPTLSGSFGSPSTPTDTDDDADGRKSSRKGTNGETGSNGADPGLASGACNVVRDAFRSTERAWRRKDARLVVPRRVISERGDSSVSARFYFTGVAVYVFCIQLLDASQSAASTFVNATFVVDEVPIQTFTHQPSTAADLAPNIIAFAHSVDAGPHVLELNLAPNSVFVLDSILVTQDLKETSSSVIAVPTASTSSGASTDNKKDRASFGGILGGVLGVLGTLAFGTAFSVYYRRRRSAARERREREANPASSSEQGSAPPAAFVPRYFPGTYIPARPTTPPPYEAFSSSHSSESGHGSGTGGAVQPSYADIPPPIEELDAAPPAFGDAIASPAVPFNTVGPAITTVPPPENNARS